MLRLLLSAPADIFADALLLLAATHDLIARTIPNRVSAGLGLIGACEMLERGDALASSTCALALFTTLLLPWWFGLLGGGDVKLLAASALVIRPGQIPSLVSLVMIAGGILALIYLAARPLVCAPVSNRGSGSLWSRARRVETWRIRRRGPLPYAIAIAVASIFEIGVG